MVLIFALSGVLTVNIPTRIDLAIPNFFGNFIGVKLFDPEKTNQYRTFAYIIIALAAISGLPFGTSQLS